MGVTAAVAASNSVSLMVSGFSTTTTTAATVAVRNNRHINNNDMTTSTTTNLYSTAEEETTTSTSSSQDDLLYIPLSFDEMVKQTSAAMEDAMKQGKNRQIVRILLPRSSDNDQLLQYYESNVVDENGVAKEFVDLVLVPPDETWQVRFFVFCVWPFFSPFFLLPNFFLIDCR
jgi:hypothetical protein